MWGVVRKSLPAATRVRVGLCLALGLATFAVVAPAQVAGAVPAPVTLFTSSTPGFTAAIPTAVPSNVCFVSVTADGGHGGAGYDATAGGTGASVTARVPVTPGDQLAAEVGGAGHVGNTPGDRSAGGGDGGVGGGGAGAGYDGDGGGGGASVVSSQAGVPLVVAGGGGGAARSYGSGGQVGGGGGLPGGTDGAGSFGGAGGLASGAGGAGGQETPANPPFRAAIFNGGGGGVGAGGAPNGGTGAANVGGGGGTGNYQGSGAGGGGGTGTGQGGTGFPAGAGGAGNGTGGNGGSSTGGAGGGGGGIGFGGGGGGSLSGGGGAGYGGGGAGGQASGGGGGSSHVINTATSSGFVASSRTGDGQVTITYDPNSDLCPPPTTNAFVIGDKTAGPLTAGTSVNFWGSQWAKNNAFTGGSAPLAMKGFANNPVRVTCGSTWTTDTGNSSAPPATLPTTIQVIVSSKVTQKGSVISGTILHIVNIQVSPGYGPDPGHPGNGKITGTVC